MNIPIKFLIAFFTGNLPAFKSHLQAEQNKHADVSGLHSDYAYYNYSFVVGWMVVMILLITTLACLLIWGAVGDIPT